MILISRDKGKGGTSKQKKKKMRKGTKVKHEECIQETVKHAV